MMESPFSDSFKPGSFNASSSLAYQCSSAQGFRSSALYRATFILKPVGTRQHVSGLVQSEYLVAP
jgi:hypothetical protein